MAETDNNGQAPTPDTKPAVSEASDKASPGGSVPAADVADELPTEAGESGFKTCFLCGAKALEYIRGADVYWCRETYGGCDRQSAPESSDHDKPERVKTWTTEDPNALADGFPATDVGNARRLIQAWGNEFQYVPAWGFVTWDGYRWRKDEFGAVQRFAKDAVRRMIHDAGDTLKLYDTDREHQNDVKAAKKLLNWAEKSSNDRRINAMIKVAESESEVVVPHEDFDAHHHLFNADNATIDLKTGQARLPERGDYLTKHTKIRYAEGATCPMWETFLLQIMNGDLDLVNYLQRVIGYSLTGSTKEHAIWILYGTGANGKSTFLNVIDQLMGDYAGRTSARTFQREKFDNTEYEIARLQGRRFISCSEMGEGKAINEEFIKMATGEEKVTGRAPYGRVAVEYPPEFKLMLAVNHKPEVRGQDYGIWRRLHLIPFEVTFSKDKQDRLLLDKLRQEMSGILNWAIRGAKDWYEGGLNTPAKVLLSTKEYQEESDILGEFLSENVYFDPKARIPAAVLRKVYHQFCEDTQLKPLSPNAFGRRLTDRGVKREKGSDGHVLLRGIGLTGDGQTRSERLRPSTLETFASN